MINKLSNIYKGAKIADNVTVEAFATIYGDVEIGSGSWIGPNAVIMDGARIGKNVKIFPGAVISGDPQDLKFQGEYTLTEIGDNTIIREYVTINKGTRAKEKTVVGKNCLITCRRSTGWSHVKLNGSYPITIEIRSTHYGYCLYPIGRWGEFSMYSGLISSRINSIPTTLF